MQKHITRIGNHVFVKGALEAVELYKKVFCLEDKGELWLDDSGLLVYRELYRDGKLFMSVSEDRHVPEKFKTIKFNEGVRPTMMFMVCFSDVEDLFNAYELLRCDENPHLEFGVNEDGTINAGDVFDKFGVYWWLEVPRDWGKSYVPK